MWIFWILNWSDLRFGLENFVEVKISPTYRCSSYFLHIWTLPSPNLSVVNLQLWKPPKFKWTHFRTGSLDFESVDPMLILSMDTNLYSQFLKLSKQSLQIQAVLLRREMSPPRALLIPIEIPKCYPKFVNTNILESLHQERNLLFRFPASRRVEINLDVESGLMRVLYIIHILLIKFVEKISKLDKNAVVGGRLDALVETCGAISKCWEDECGVCLEEQSE